MNWWKALIAIAGIAAFVVLVLAGHPWAALFIAVAAGVMSA